MKPIYLFVFSTKYFEKEYEYKDIFIYSTSGQTVNGINKIRVLPVSIRKLFNKF